jgi:hypothetical protein
MTTTTITTTITSSNNPFTLGVGDTISIATGNGGNSNEAIYTDYQLSNATTIGGPTIVIDGVVLDTAPLANKDEYAIQSRTAADATIINYGIIISKNMNAIGVNDGRIVNEIGSTIAGTGGIVIGYGSLQSTIINEGLITGSSFAAITVLESGANIGFVQNSLTGTIIGGASGGALDESGIVLRSGTVTNAGTISQGGAAGYSVDFTGTTGDDTLILDPGQVLKGEATAAGTGNYILLGGTGLGTLTNPGNYHGFTLISVAQGSDWQIGTAGESVAVPGVGTINVGGTLDVLGSITGTDFNMTGTASVVDFTAPLSSTADSNNLGRITHFGPGDSFIVGPSVLVTQAGDTILTNYNTATGVYTILDEQRLGDPDDTVQITVSGTSSPNALTADNFTLTTGPGGITVSEMPCFGAGTEILTPDGMIAVENLAVGDEVLSARTGAPQKIIWTGARRVDVARHANPEKVMPVRVRAGALAPGLPERDLILSPDHALLLDGHLVEAKTLVNGATILWDKSRRAVTYHHIELAEHDVVLAEGIPAETFLDSGNRKMFEGNAFQLHPDFASDREDRSCAKLLLEGPALMAIRQKLLERALRLGFAQTAEADLTIQAGNRVLAPSVRLGQTIRFALPAGCTSVTLLSSTGVPAETGADPSDRRVLGAAIASLALTAENGRETIDLNDPGHTGFHDAEPSHRWTNGAATLALPLYEGQAILDVTLTGQAVRWVSPAAVRAA